MDVSAPHILTEDLAEFLPEVTESDLRRPAPGSTGTLCDRYLQLIDQNLDVAEAITGQSIPQKLRADRPDRASLGTVADFSENAFVAATDPPVASSDIID